MEELNKNQIVLLTLLVSFVTSIATGIMTTSLLQEAPVEITRNINRIVEKTLETVTPSTATTPAQKEVTTVVVKEEDLIIDSINKNLKSVVRVEEKDVLSSVTSFYGMGVVVSKDGFVAADRKAISSGNTYTAIMSDGTVLRADPMGTDKQTNFILFKAIQDDIKTTATSTSKATYVFVTATLSDSEPKLGQTIIGLGGIESNAVTVGRINSFDMKETTTASSTTKYLSGIVTDLSTKDLVDGSPLFNLSGDVVGIKLSAEFSKTFVPISILKKELSSLLEPTKTP